MKSFLLALTGFLTCLNLSCFSQNAILIDLHKEVMNKNITVYNRELSLIDEGPHSGFRLSKDAGERVVWLKGVEFSNGILEFDVRGEDVKQHSFVGIAFHGKDNVTFEAIYLRPFQFKAQDEVLKSHSIQYISLPDFTWRTLRDKFPNKYERAIEPSPDPNSWVRVRVVIKDSTISTYINGNPKPCMVVETASQIHSGALGFYVADTSGGDFSNLSITKTN